jgi:3-keto-L-gulonate-6-phosphate decarboxylase
MTSELDVLGIVANRLEAAHVPYMLTGSFAMAYYATPRMTRDLDIVVALKVSDAAALAAQFSVEFYVDAEAVQGAARVEGFFNLMHLASGIKVDFIVRKSAQYRQVEFERRKRVEFAGIDCYIVSREDLILSKLVWSRETRSELQHRDVRALLHETVDQKYLRRWAIELGVLETLEELAR